MKDNNNLPLAPSERGNSANSTPPLEGVGGRSMENISSPKPIPATNNHYNKSLKNKAKRLRNESTITEATLWKYVLRASGLGYPFKRQRSIGKYIADFVSLPIKLIIEVDGITHSYDEVAEKDEIRQKELENLGFTIIRISDDEILLNLDRVRNYLLEEIKNLSPTLETSNRSKEGVKNAQFSLSERTSGSGNKK